MSNVMLQEWIEYRNACYPGVRLTATQERETQQAFFAGAMTFASKLPLVQGMSDEDGAKYLHARMSEVIEQCQANIIALNYKERKS